MPTKFSLVRLVPSCFVDKPLIQSLEDYLRQRIAPLPDTRGQNPPPVVTIEVSDDIGTEAMESISQFGPARFHDGTKRITVGHSSLRPDHLSANIIIDRERSRSEIRVTYTADKGTREFVIGLVDGIERILAPSKTTNSWLHPVYAVDSLISLFTFAVAMTTLYMSLATVGAAVTNKPSTIPRWVSTTSFIVLWVMLTYHALAWLKPYSTFDTAANARRRSVTTWVFGGLATFIVFTVFGDYLRKWVGF